MNILEKIELYLENRLSPEEKILFEEEISRNKELAAEVQRRKRLHRSITETLSYPSIEIDNGDNFQLTALQNLQIEEDIRKYHKPVDKEPSEELKLTDIIKSSFNSAKRIKTGRQLIFVRLAAGIAAILVISFIVFYMHDSGKIKKTIFEQQNVCEIFPHENDTYLKDLMSSLLLLRHGTDSLPGIPDNNYTELDKKSREALILSDAINNLENANFTQARKRLKQIINSENTDIQLAATWYYSLLCMEEKNFTEALNTIKTLSEDNNYYNDKADSLRKLIHVK